jgi:hypothetical protein
VRLAEDDPKPLFPVRLGATVSQSRYWPGGKVGLACEITPLSGQFAKLALVIPIARSGR